MILVWRRWWAGAKSRQAARPSRRGRSLRFESAVEQLEDRVVPSTLIPVQNHRDLVFDPTRNVLYITTGSGSVQEFSVNSQALLAPLNIGASLNGADITADGSSLYVTDSQTLNSTTGVVHQVNLVNGMPINLPYNLASYEGGSFDVALGANGKGLFDGRFNGSGWVPLRQITLGNDTLSVRTDDPGSGGGGQVRQNTLIHRSADRSEFLFTESNISSGPIFLYNATTDTFTRGPNQNLFLDNALSAVSRNGQLIAIEEKGGVVVMDRNFTRVAFLSGLTGGVVFDPTADVLYAVNPSTSQVVAYDTNTWAVKYQMAIGETVPTGSAFGNGVMAVSSDGSYLFLATPSGVREFALPVTSGPLAHFTVSGFPSQVTAGTTGPFTVVTQDAAGHTVTNYTGTVHFYSSDTGAILPADYTFTTADHGVHTFSATLRRAGTQSINVMDYYQMGITGAESGITVNPGAFAGVLLNGIPGNPVAGTPSSPFVYAVDAYGNVVPTYTGTVTFSSSDSRAALPGSYTFTSADRGSHTFTNGVTLVTAGGQTVTVLDAQHNFGSQVAVTVQPGAAARFVLSLPSMAAAGTPFSIMVRAVDAYGNTATGYQGTVGVGSTDPAGSMPAPYTFKAADQGVHTFTNGVTLNTTGNQSVTAYDSTTNTLNASASLTVVPPQIVGLHFTLSLSSTTTPAGTALGVTVTALDGNNNVATNYGGTVHFSTTDFGRGVVLPADYTFTAADQGVHTFSLTLVTAGNQTVSVSDSTYVTSAGGYTGGGNPPSGSASVQVVPAAASSLTFSGFPTAVTAGTSFNLTLTARDAYGNIATGYNDTLYFNSGDSQAVLPGPVTLTNGAGAFTVTLKTAGLQAIGVIDPTSNPVLWTGTGNIAVSAAAASTLQVTGFPASTTAGAPATFTVTALDAYGNVASTYNGTVHFSSSDAQAVLPANATLANGTGSFTATLKTAGTQSLSAVDAANGSIAGSQSGITVQAAAASTLSISGFPAGVTAGVSGTFTVTALDAYGNVATGYSGTVHFSSSDAQAVLPADATLTNGAATFNATLKTAGTQSLTVTDAAHAGLTATESGIAVSPAAATHFVLTAPPSAEASFAFSVTVTAFDAFGNVATGYLGSVVFSSSDGGAYLPSAYTFVSGDNGSHTFTSGVFFVTPGDQTLTVADTGDGSIEGSTTVSVYV